MRFIIHNGDKDSIIVSGDTIGEIVIRADVETKKRGWQREDLWSEEIEVEDDK